MPNWFSRTFLVILQLPVYFLVILFSSPIFANDNESLKQIALLEDDFRTLSSVFYKKTSKAANKKLKKISDIDQLSGLISKITNKHPITAIQLLHFNIDTVRNNLDHKSIFQFIELLLEKNEWHLANSLFNSVKEEGDKSLLATVHFIFAKYHAARHEWSQVNKLLDGMLTELSEEDTAFAYILQGSALQHLKKHRQAIKHYNKVPASSSYYVHAQLNTAIANIRQGWWTDAQTTINNVIKIADKDNSDELINRLYLVLGYSLLQREYYRDARDSFRDIGLDNRYTNRALLGIGLTAINQGDYVGGLNALSILKDKRTFDLSVDESYLLMPYVYEKLQQQLTVTASYTEAMNYFQRRINTLNKISDQHLNFVSTKYIKKTASIIVQNNSLDYGKHYPESFISNYHQLLELLANNNNKKVKSKLEKLISKHDKTFQKIINELLSQRKEYLKSYLNQSRYGLARLYDKTNEATN